MKYITFIGFLFLITGFSECSKDRPINTLPDGDKQRMLKDAFSGTEKDPKYWMYKVTVVDTSFEGGLGFVFEGVQSDIKVGYFDFTQYKLKFHNIVTRQSMETPEVSSQGIHELINEWDITHFKTRLKEVDGYVTNREEEDKYVSWDQKPHFMIDWSKADISEANTFPQISYSQDISCWKKKTSYLINRFPKDISDERRKNLDYMSFTVAVEYEQNQMCSKNLERKAQQNFVTTVYYKYSFRRVSDPREKDENYTPYVYTGEEDPLLKKYGYFRTIRPIIAEDYRDKNIFYMNRWNPNKKHIFYFSKDYPEEYKDIAYGVICHTNKLFAKHKLNDYPLNGTCTDDGLTPPGPKETCSKGICFELKENKGQELGDIRYSFFHAIKRQLPLLGYGPTDVHPATGEIVGGSVVISTYYLDFYLKLLQERYKRDREEYYKEDGTTLLNNKNIKYQVSPLFVNMKNILGEDNHELWTNTSEDVGRDSPIRSDFEYLLSNLTFGHPAYSRFTNAYNPVSDISLNLSPRVSHENVKDIELEMNKYQKLFQEAVEQSHHHQKFIHERSTTIYPSEPVIAQIPSLLANGMTPDEIKKRILFRLISHEFGHVLNLRHNYYGSVDVRHWSKDEAALKTSSIMDYSNLKDFAEGPLKAVFAPYDEAALVYAYSGGMIDLSKEKNTQYLFCTDHHVELNFLCNGWDRGSTPSQVMMSFIENYEESYFLRNLRAERAYWDTSSYIFQVFTAMLNVKRALVMWNTAFNEQVMLTLLNQSTKSYTDREKNLISKHVKHDIKQAIKLSLAFYHSVLQLSRTDDDSDRYWKNRFSAESGSIERVGVLWDKIFAMYFLMGDDKILSNPNSSQGTSSYLINIDELDDSNMIDEIIETILTVRGGDDFAPPWLIAIARYLFAQNVSGVYNVNEAGQLLKKIGVDCYTPLGLKSHLGIDPKSYVYIDYNNSRDFTDKDLNVAVIPMSEYPKILDRYRSKNINNEYLGVILLADGNYYTAASNRNKYSYSLIKGMKQDFERGATDRDLFVRKQDLDQMFRLYNAFKTPSDNDPKCDDGV